MCLSRLPLHTDMLQRRFGICLLDLCFVFASFCCSLCHCKKYCRDKGDGAVAVEDKQLLLLLLLLLVGSGKVLSMMFKRFCLLASGARYLVMWMKPS